MRKYAHTYWKCRHSEYRQTAGIVKESRAINEKHGFHCNKRESGLKVRYRASQTLEPRALKCTFISSVVPAKTMLEKIEPPAYFVYIYGEMFSWINI